MGGMLRSDRRRKLATAALAAGALLISPPAALGTSIPDPTGLVLGQGGYISASQQEASVNIAACNHNPSNYRGYYAASATASDPLDTSDASQAQCPGDPSPVPALPPARGTLTWHVFTNSAGSREYGVYVPPGKVKRSRPIVVYLHGCTSLTTKFPWAATGEGPYVGWDQLADRLGFIVVYPVQSLAANGSGCWQWFQPADQQRGSGEPSIIAGITEHVLSAYDGARNRVYVAGISAGADMATVMEATYPDLYAAEAVIAGCPYLSCSDTTGALAYHEMGARARPVPVLIFQGTNDELNVYPAGRALVGEWLGIDALTGGLRPSTTQPTPALRYHAAQPNRQGYLVETYDDAHGCPLIQVYDVIGMNHAYPGVDFPGYDAGPTAVADPWGPAFTPIAARFLLRQRQSRPATCS